MRSALGVELRTGRLARAFEDGRTEAVAPDAITDAPDAVALALGDGLDASAWRDWVRTRFGFDALEVAEDVARTYSEDSAAGAALWALAGGRKRGAGVVVPPVAGSADPVTAADASTMADFGDGRSMSEFGDGQSMSDFKEPAQMSDFGEGNQMGDFGEGGRMADVGGRPAGAPPAVVPVPPATSTFPKLKVQIAIAAAAVIAVVAGSTAVLALAGDSSTAVPVFTGSPPTAPTPASITTTSIAVASGPFVQGTRFYDVTYTVIDTVGPGSEQFAVGDTGRLQLVVSCFEQDETCWTSLEDESGRSLHLALVTVAFDGALDGTLSYRDELNDPCDRIFTDAIEAAMSDDGTVEGIATRDADPLNCTLPDGSLSSADAFTLEFAGTLTEEIDFVVGSPPAALEEGSTGSSTTTTFPAGEPQLPAANAG